MAIDELTSIIIILILCIAFLVVPLLLTTINIINLFKKNPIKDNLCDIGLIYAIQLSNNLTATLEFPDACFWAILFPINYFLCSIRLIKNITKIQVDYMIYLKYTFLKPHL